MTAPRMRMTVTIEPPDDWRAEAVVGVGADMALRWIPQLSLADCDRAEKMEKLCTGRSAILDAIRRRRAVLRSRLNRAGRIDLQVVIGEIICVLFFAWVVLFFMAITPP